MWVLVSVFESKDVYTFKRNTVPEYLFSTSAYSETATSMEAEPPEVAPFCVTFNSVTQCQMCFLSQQKLRYVP